MPTIWGDLDGVNKDRCGTWWVQVRTVLPGGTAIRVRASVGNQTLIARGIERVDVSNLREGEFVEVTYYRGQSGVLEAETISVRPDQVPVA
jgi:hypothetical protein